MISKDLFPVYAQYNEDIILAALLHKVKRGFYVDVGANEEEYHSVTKYFYERGWSGLNIEPIPRLIEKLKKKRPRDINLPIAVSREAGKLEFREYPDYDGLSTLSEESKAEPDKTDLPHKDYTIDVLSLKGIFAENTINKIDFLKIDVEGYEFEVLEGNDWNTYRPTVICIEANHRSNETWYKFLEARKYVRVIFDGLNEYYIASESIKIFDGFAERAALLAHNAVRSHHVKAWQVDINRIQFLEDFTNRQDKLIRDTQDALEGTQKLLHATDQLSFKDKPYKERLRIALRGLITDYYRHRSSK